MNDVVKQFHSLPSKTMLGIIPFMFDQLYLTTQTHHELKNMRNIIPAIHGFTHGITKEKFNSAQYDEFHDNTEEEAALKFKEAKKILDSFFGKSNCTYIPPYSFLSPKIMDGIHNAGFKFIYSDIVDTYNDERFKYVKSDLVTNVSNFHGSTAKPYKVCVFNLQLEVNFILQHGYEVWKSYFNRLRLYSLTVK